MDLQKLEIAIRKNLILDFDDWYTIGISFPSEKRVKLLNRSEKFSILVDFSNLKLLKEKNFLKCEVKSDTYYDLKVINILYRCIREAVKYLIGLGD